MVHSRIPIAGSTASIGTKSRGSGALDGLSGEDQPNASATCRKGVNPRAERLLSDPYVPRGPVRPTVVFEQITKDKNFYQAYFQEPGKVERELEEDVHRTMLGVLYGGSGDASAEQRSKFLFDKNQRFADTFVLPEKLPPWLTEQDLNFFTSQFKQSGFRGGVNWYRNIDRNWELTPFLYGAKIIQPTVFAAGDRDMVMEMSPDGYKMLETNAPNLHKKYLIPGAGHWIQQERPTEISQLLVEFLKEL